VEKSEIKKIFSQGTQRHKFIGIDVDKKNNKIARFIVYKAVIAPLVKKEIRLYYYLRS
jgi:hypothetical protein